MALADEIRKAGISVQRIALEVRIAGRVQGNVISVSASHGFDQVNSQATITLYQKSPEAEEGAAVEVRAGYNGQMALVFRGELSGVSWAHFPAGISLDARSILARVEMKWAGGDYEYTSQDDAAVIRNLLEKYGIPNTEANIELSGWTLGEIQPVPFVNGDTGQSLIAQIDELAGYRTFTIASGVVLRRRISGKAGPSAAWNFKRGVDIISAKRMRTLDGVVNHAIVRGLTYEDLEVVQEASAPNAYIPNPPGEAAYETQSDLVETDAKALEIATRIVADRNRRPERLELQVIGNPLIQPGATIQVDHSDLGVSGARVFVENVSHSISDQGFTTTIRTTGGNLSGYEPAAPVAQLALDSFLEGEDTGSGVETRIVLIADGSGSFDPAGGPLSYAWTVAPDVGTATPDTGTTAVLQSIITGAATSITVTLVVTNSAGDTATASEVLPITTGAQQIEILWSAEGTIIACSADGQQTWREQTLPGGASATCLCAIAPAWGQLWGASDGHLYASFDGLISAPADFGAPHGVVAVTAVWAHETNSSRLWAAFNDGQVWYGALDVSTKAATWSLAGTVPAAPVNEIRESYGTLGELRATAGANEYYSSDAGATWSVGLAGTGMSPAAWRMAAGFDRNAVAFTSGDPILLEAGEPAPTITPAPTGGLRGLSFGYRQQELYAADGSNPARLYRSGPDFATLDEVGAAAGLTQINHLIRSGNEDGIVYMAGGDGTADGGVIKAMRMEAPWYARRTGARKVHMVGYGGAAPKVVNVVLLVLASTSEPAATRGLWVLRGGVWAQQNGAGGLELPLNGSTIWNSVAGCPFNPQRWLAIGYTPTVPLAYLTEDAGATWHEITLGIPAGSSAPGGYSATYAVFSARTPGEWLVTGYSRTGFGDYSHDYFWRGTGTTVDTSAYATGFSGLGTTGTGPIASLVAGSAGDFLLSGGASGGTATLWRIPAGSAAPAVLHNTSGRVLWLDRPIGGAQLASAITSFGSFGPFPDQEELFTSANYATTAPASTGADIGQSVALAGGVAFGAGKSAGAAGITAVRRIDDPFGTPAASTIAATTSVELLGEIRSDRQTQTALAVRVASDPVTYWVSNDGSTTWARIAGPPVAAANLLTTHEVVSG